MEKKLWSNAEVLELGVENTKNNETEEAWLIWCDKRGCSQLKVPGTNYCEDHQPEKPKPPHVS